MQDPRYKIVLSDYIDAVSDKKAVLQRDGCIVLRRLTRSNDYMIVDVGPSSQTLPKYYGEKSIEVVQRPGLVALPAFFDMHFHWVQDAVCLMPKDSLIKWLQNYTWPYEAKFINRDFSRKHAFDFSQKLLRVGTLGGACYGSIHKHTVDDALKCFTGDFVVGNVLMTRNSPPSLIQTENQAMRIVEQMAKTYRECYALTPRFAITVSPKLMKESALVARKYKCFVQTHLSETLNEIETVLSIYARELGYKNVDTYTGVYKKSGILGPKTILGHGIHLAKHELKLLAKARTKIAHCPSSNAPIRQKGLGSGLFDFRKTERFGVDWALGSDIGAGPYLSMFDVMNSFVTQNQKVQISEATYSKALCRATLSGARLLGLDKTHGSLAIGKFANMIFVPSPRETRGETAEDVLRKIVGRCRNRRHLYDEMVLETMYKGHSVYVS